jgi:hypothetical protein
MSVDERLLRIEKALADLATLMIASKEGVYREGLGLAIMRLKKYHREVYPLSWCPTPFPSEDRGMEVHRL